MSALKKNARSLKYGMRISEVMKIMGNPAQLIKDEKDEQIYLFVDARKGLKRVLFGDFDKVSLLFVEGQLVNAREARSKTLSLDSTALY